MFPDFPDKQADVIDAFNTTSRYLDDILNINYVYFDNMVSQIYPSELQLNKANASDTEAAFLDLHLSTSNDIVSTKIYDKRDDFDFEIVNFPFLDGDVPRSTSYGVYISQLIRFARASSYVADFNTRNKLLTQKLLKQGYRYHKLRKTFSKFYRRYYDLISKFQVGLKSLLRQGLSEPDFYGDLVYKLKKIVGVPVYLAPWTGCPPGGKPTAVALPPGGQAVPGYLAPHPGYLHPRGASCPGRFILPPPQHK